MTHADKGKYKDKHSKERKLDQRIKLSLEERTADSKITCADASSITDELGVAMNEVGVAVDLMERPPQDRHVRIA